MLWGESRRLRVRCSASKSIMKALAEVISRFTQRRPRRSAAATGARGWRIAKYFALLAVFAGAAGASRANAQDSQGPLTPAPSEEHNVRRLGTEPEPPAPPSLHPDEIIRRLSLQVDEIDCDILKVKPEVLDRTHAYLDGLVWVDTKYLEVVKTYGRWVNELGDVRSATLPFTLFETYRENVDGKYWFPNYERSDDTLHLKDVSVPVRLVIKWTDFKPLPAMAAAPSATPPSAPATTQTPTKPPQ